MFVTRDGKTTVEVVHRAYVSRGSCPEANGDGEYFCVKCGPYLVGCACTLEGLARLVPLDQLQEVT